jgi:2,6-dihydroxypseudooxynicotine hydrolase
MGVSLGGFYAPYSAAHDARFDACVGISGVFSVGPVSKYSSDLLKEQFKWACKTDSLVEVDDITEQMSLRECIDDLTMPSLMITGAQDTIVYPEETERIATHAPDGEYVLFEEGNHVCNNIPYKYKPYMADWMRRQLR